MEKTIVKINPAEFGVEEVKANELTTGLNVTLKEREFLIAEFDKVSKLSFADGNTDVFKTLRLKIVKNRTMGIIAWHKVSKDYFLKGGQFVDAIKRKEIAVNEEMESKLMEGEKYYENLEIKRLEELQQKRATELSIYLEDAHERDLSNMPDDVWGAYLAAKKKEHTDKIAAEKKADAERIAAEKAEVARVKKIEAENKKLAKEKAAAEKLAAEKEKIQAAKDLQAEKEREQSAKIAAEKLAKEKAERQKIADQLEAKRIAEVKESQRLETEKQNESNRGDAEKLKALLSDLKHLKTAYSFKSSVNIKMYKDVNILIDKVVNHINK